MKYIVTAGLIAFTALGCGEAGSKVSTGFKDLLGQDSKKKSADDNGGDGAIDGGEQPSPLNLAPHLKTFASCAEAEAHIEDQLIADMRRKIDQQIEYLKSRDKINAAEPMANTGAAEDRAENDSSSSAESAGPDEYTTTNNQVEGVEEADYLKNTGTHIYHLAAGKLHILQSWPADAMKEVASVDIAGRAITMLLDGARLVVLSYPPIKMVQQDDPSQGGAPIADSSIDYFYQFSRQYVQVTTLDVSNPEAPTEVSRFLLKGSYISSRRVNSSLRIVLNDHRPLPAEVRTYIDWPDRQKMNDTEVLLSLEALKDKNTALIRGKDLAYWLDTDAFVKIDGDTKQPVLDLQDCSNIHAPTVSTQFGLTRIATLNIEADSMTETLLLTYANQIYSSKESLYVATPYWWWSSKSRDTDFTYVHKFDITDASAAFYSGSGGFEGSLLNQFSMDEYEGNLRVAATVTHRPPPTADGIWQPWETTNRVYVLAQAERTLEVIGQTTDLAKGERIFSARFDGARGFVVTFRQVDPLFTLDLSSPSEPRVVGELKIPGFSSYIHMIDENHLLTVGRDATLEGRVQGLKLSIFDVSDMANPVETHNHVLEGSFWSQAQWDHKAFTYFKAKSKLAIPATGYTQGSSGPWYNRYRSTLLVFDISTSTGIAAAGSLEMNDIYTSSERPWGWWSTAAMVSRSIFADDFVYAISNLGIRSARIDALDAPLATARYECNDACYGWWWR